MSALYTPNPGAEAAAYESLWKISNPSGGDLSGAQAVAFFRKSDVEPTILKQIWGLSTPLATMNKSQFNVALRFITMAQNGDLPLSPGNIFVIDLVIIYDIIFSLYVNIYIIYTILL